MKTLGNEMASENDIDAVVAIMRKTGAVGYAKEIAKDYVSDALKHLDLLPSSDHKELLELWAEYMIEREF